MDQQCCNWLAHRFDADPNNDVCHPKETNEKHQILEIKTGPLVLVCLEGTRHTSVLKLVLKESQIS